MAPIKKIRKPLAKSLKPAVRKPAPKKPAHSARKH